MNVHDEDHVPIPRQADEGRHGTIWVLFLAGPTIWLSHFLLVYVLGEVLCKPLRTGVGVAGLPLVSFLTLAATVAAAAATAVFAVLAHRRWVASREVTARSPAEHDVARGHDQALALAGMLLSALFFVGVLFTGAPALVLRPC